MIFVFKREALLFKYLVQPDDGDDQSFYAQAGDICLILMLKKETERSYVLHPEHGPVWTYVKGDRGYIWDCK